MEVVNLVIDVLNKRLIVFIVLTFSIAFQAVLGVSIGTTLAITVEDSNYEIMEDGDLHVRVIGSVSGTSAFFCKFSINFLDNFSMNTLDDGTSVLKFGNDGYSIENTFNDNYFQVDFQLNSYNTTTLPEHFIFTVITATGSESVIIEPEWCIKVENSTTDTDELFIADPTGQTPGYPFSKSQTGLIELLGSRGQTYQHYYDIDNGKYKFVSNTLVKKSDVIDDADWLTFQEYPIKFLVQTTDNKVFSCSQDEISPFFKEITNNSVQRILIDTFNGMAGFSVVSQESSTLGHGETLFYPRLSTGSVPSINNPYFSSFGRLSVLKDGKYSSEIINNRYLFTDDSKEPVNSLHFDVENEIFQIWYELKNITIFSQQFDLRIGLKYNSIERKFHTINHVTCNTMDYDDIGFGYEICDSIQEKILDSDLTRLKVQNSTHYINLPVNSSIDIKSSFSDILPQVSVFNENNNILDYSFADMKQVGFTNTDFSLHESLLPSGELKKSIFVGMHGYGKYSKGETLEIDPEFSSTILDNNDVSLEILRVSPYTKTKKTDYNWVGFTNGDDKEYRSFLSWDTGITEEITTVSNSNLHIFCATTTFDYGVPQLKLIKQYTGSSPNENDNVNTLYSYFDYSSYVAPGYLSYLDPEFNTAENKQVDYYLNYWADNKGSGSVIKFRIQEYYADYDEYCRYYTDALAPSLSFDYEYEVLTPSLITSFVADDEYKGLQPYFKTYVTNTDPVDSYVLDTLRYEIFGDDYNNWLDWTPDYEHNEIIAPSSSKIVFDFIDPIFTNYDDDASYALNVGDYYVESVIAGGHKGDIPWIDGFYPNELFEVEEDPYWHPVFVAHLVDDDFRDRYNEDEYFSSIIDEIETFSIDDSDATLKGTFYLNYMSKFFSWECNSRDIDYIFGTEILVDAAELLGLTNTPNIWINNLGGTSRDNNGFDQLFGHATGTCSLNSAVGVAKQPGNSALLLGGYIKIFEFWINGDSEDVLLLTWHEMLHNFDCGHVTNMPWNIMDPSLLCVDNLMRSSTVSTLWNNIDHFDSP